MQRSPRPLVPLAFAVVLGAAWGSLGWAEPWQVLLLLPLVLSPSTRPLALVVGAMFLRSVAVVEETVQPAVQGTVACGRFEPEPSPPGSLELRGRVAGRRLLLPAGGARAGEWVALLGPGRERREALGPAGGGRGLSQSLGSADLLRLAPPPSHPTANLPRLLRPAAWPWFAWRSALLARLAASGEGHARDESRALVAALLLGERSGLDPSLIDRFTRTGTRHLLALSGLHVGLVAWLVAGPLARLFAALFTLFARRPLPAAPGVLRALGVLALVPLAGGGPPVTRAALALALAALAPELDRKAIPGGRGIDPLSLWALALILELATDPSALGAIGFQLSYAATLALILAAGPVCSRLHQAWIRRPLVGGGSPGPVLWNWLTRLGLASIAASWVATLATAPLAWHAFGELSPWGILLTPLALPPLLLLLTGGWLALCLPALAPWGLLDGAARALFLLVRLGDALPGTPIELPPRPLLLLIGTALLLLMASAGKGTEGAGRLGALLGGILCLPWTLGPARFEVCALDVGHGTAILARAPGAGTWLFDAGSRDRASVGRAAVGPLLREWDVGRLAVVLSHTDRDHSGALEWILARWTTCLRAGAPMPGKARLDLDRGRLLLPSRGELGATLLRGERQEGNEGSRALELRFGKKRVLLLGDAEEEGLAAALDADLFTGPVDLLLLPHHGSHTHHLDALLEATQPHRAWISTSGEAPIGPELTRRGIEWASTGHCGFLEGP